MSKKILPIALIGIGVLAAGIAVLSKPKPIDNTQNIQNTNTNTAGGWIEAITNLFATISTGITNITGAYKGSGIINSSKRVLFSNQNYTGIEVDTTKGLKVGETITIIPEINSDLTFAGKFKILALGDQFGNLKDTLIVIQKPFVLSTKPTKGTFTES